MKLLSKISRSDKLERILFWSIAFFSFLYIFSIPTFGESESKTRYLVYISMVLLGFSVVVYCLLFGSFKLKREVLLVPFFVLIALIGTIIYSKAFREWLTLILVSTSFIIFIYAFKILRDKYFILNIFVVAFFLFYLYFIFYFRNSFLRFSFSTRLGPPFDNQNGVAAYAVVGFSISLYLLLFLNRKIKYLYFFPILASLLVGVSTGSRTFFFIVLLFVFVFLFFKFKKHKIIYLSVVAIFITSSFVFINLPFMDSFRLRLITSLETLFGIAAKVDTSTLQRTVYIDYGFYLGSKNLFFGYGVDGFSIYSGVGTYAHSNYAETICNFGLVGVVLFYLPIVILLLKAITSNKIDRPFVISFFLYYIIVSFSNVFYYKKVYYLILSLLYYFVFFDPLILAKKPLINSIGRVVFTCDSMNSGGAEQVISILSNEMSSQNILVTIIGVSSTNSLESFYSLKNGVNYVTLTGNSGKRMKSLKRIFVLRRTIKELKPDVVISFLPHVIVYTKFSLLFTEIPLIVSERNNPYINPKGKVLRLLRRLSFNLADGCVFQTKDAMCFFSRKLVNKSIIIKNPLDLKYIPESCHPTKNKIVLAVGRLTEQKNYKCLLDAFSTFNKNLSFQYKLKIYGEGSLENDLKKYCMLKGIDNYVLFMGCDKEWHKKEYNDAMFVLSSNYEGMPNALAEAMALGIPSISTDCPTGGPRELIKNGVNGFLVPVNDSSALAKKMAEIITINSAVFYNETRKMVDDYSAQNITNKWLAFIKSLTNEVYE